VGGKTLNWECLEGKGHGSTPNLMNSSTTGGLLQEELRLKINF
jgi:hypothetical protein